MRMPCCIWSRRAAWSHSWSPHFEPTSVVGAVLVGTPRANLLMRLHEWDYYLGIGAVKGMQDL